MNEENTRINESASPTDAPKKPARRRWLGYSLAGLAGVLGITAVTAIAQGGPDGWCRDGGYSRMHWGGGKHRDGNFDPAQAREFAEHRADRLLYELDATPEQRQQVKDILGKAFEEMSGLRRQRGADRQAMIEILSQPEIDRAKLQTLRTERLQQMEQMSERMMQAFADAAEVLTPEQRARLGEVIGKRGFGPGRHRW